MTAQENYRRMLNGRISPGLRDVGFRGSSGSYTLPSEAHWILLGFQRSTSTDSSVVRFTVNCKVVRRDVWDAMRSTRPYLRDRPNPNVSAGTFEWHEPLGLLMPEHADRWWSLAAHADPESLASEVLVAIRAYALPAIRQEMSRTLG